MTYKSITSSITTLFIGLLCFFGTVFIAAAQDESIISPKEAESRIFSNRATLLMKENELSAKVNHLHWAIELDSTNVAAHAELGNIAAQKGNLLLATEYLMRSYTLSNKDPFFGQMVLRLAMATQSEELALKVGEELLENSPEDLEVLDTMARLYEQKRMPEKSIAYLRRMNGILSDDLTVTFRIAQNFAANKQEEEGLKEIKRYISEHPMELRGYLSLAGFLNMIGKEKEAIKSLEAMPQSLQSSLDVMMIRARLALKESNYKEAKRVLSSLLRTEGLDPQAIDELIEQLAPYASKENTSFFQEFVPFLEDIRKEYDQTSSIDLFLAELYLLQEKKEKAEAIYSELMDRGVSDMKPYSYMVQQALEAKDPVKVITIAEKGRAAHPTKPDFYIYSILALGEQDRTDEALAAANRGLEVADKNALLYGHLLFLSADLLNEKGNVDEALKRYEQALGYLPKDALLLNNYAYALATANRNIERAESLASEAIRIDSSNASFLDTYAWILYLRENYSLAKYYIESAIRNSPEGASSVLLEHYGDILWKLNDKEKAIKAWKDALNANPENAEEIKKKIEQARP
ncbi:MAG: tetratricopeptide repeat protein [Porphyromonas sp.]|nr:tetratricopeptide repeat protein [Porphyromonas sp.]